MKIMFVSSSSGSRGGGELYLLFLAEALVNQGVNVCLWCSSHSRMDELADSFSTLGKVFRSEYKNTYDYSLRSIRYLLPKTVEGLQTAIDNFIPDIIHLNKQNLEDGLDLVKTLDKLNIPYITTIHITQTQKALGALLGGLRDVLSRRTLQRSKSLKWITVSSNRFLDFSRFLKNNTERIILIPNGVKIENHETEVHRKEIKIKLNIPEDSLIVITVGRLEEQKDPFRFVDWAEKCLRMNKKLRFYWIGDGRLRNEFEAKIKELGLNDSIICLGWQRDVRPFYASADIYLHTARFEGLPFSLLEAMSWRLPCVVSEELYDDLSFPEKVLFKGIKGLELAIDDASVRKETGDFAHEYVANNLSQDVITKSYLEVYKNIIS